MPQIYAFDGIVPVVDPHAFVHDAAVVIGDVIAVSYTHLTLPTKA